jgi:hypothetical protein
VSDSLPKTSYVKLVDVWMIFSLSIPFVEVLIQIFIDYLYNKENREKGEYIFCIINFYISCSLLARVYIIFFLFIDFSDDEKSKCPKEGKNGGW